MICKAPATGVDINARHIPCDATITRMYCGRRYVVEVVDPPSAITPAAQRRGWWRYVFQGERFKSLSAIAFKITGDRFMSGHRFFGLRGRRRGNERRRVHSVR